MSKYMAQKVAGKTCSTVKEKTLRMVMESATSIAKEKLLKESDVQHQGWALKPRRVQQSWYPYYLFIFPIKLSVYSENYYKWALFVFTVQP